jgi:hypothetical protein
MKQQPIACRHRYTYEVANAYNKTQYEVCLICGKLICN